MITKYLKRLSSNVLGQPSRLRGNNPSTANTESFEAPSTSSSPAQAFPVLSSIVLNWNRADLLHRTLDSLAATVNVPHELLIVDNNSTDGSREVITNFCKDRSGAQAMLLDTNRGGEAINVALEKARGRLIHISENDIEYLPGWCEFVIALFESFPKLGQLSPFGPVPEDEEVWVNKPCVLRHRQGRILYESFANLGTTCVLRRELIDRGIRVHNIPSEGTYLLPDDIRLSREVQESGYLIALAPHYLVHNLGHWAAEFQTRPEYYRENYRSKPVGEQEWHERIARWKSRLKPKRTSFLLPNESVSTEKSEPNAECPEPWLWSMFDGWTAEVETIEFLYALVRLIKPRFVLETGTWHGIAALAMGSGLRDNGRGELVSIELDEESHAVAARRIRDAALEERVRLLRGSSLDFVPDRLIDMALFDSDLSLRGREFEHYRSHLAPGALVLFHDTSTTHKVVAEAVDKLIADRVLDGFLLPTPRGLALCRFRS
jgi:predicted O-methyltransferase YrrM/GT2 family glycosyltransferase